VFGKGRVTIATCPRGKQGGGTLKRLIGITAVLAVAITSALAFGAAKSQAGLITGLLGCPGLTYTQPFAQWGDRNSYFMGTGGSFEGSNSWSLAGGAQVVTGNEPFYLNSKSDSHSLLLTPGSSATSPVMCLAALSPHLRAVGKSSDGSAVHVDVYATGVLGLVKLPVSADIDLSSSWAPSGDVGLLLQNVLALTNLGKTSVVFRLSPIGSATVQIDDFYIDPIFHE
jgi:hypothetical protein